MKPDSIGGTVQHLKQAHSALNTGLIQYLTLKSGQTTADILRQRQHSWYSNRYIICKGIMPNSGAKLYFGVNAWDSYFKGAVDEIMLFNKALSEDEVHVLNAGIGVNFISGGDNTANNNNSNNNNNNSNSNDNGSSFRQGHCQSKEKGRKSQDNCGF